jgi:hypothetical protein
MKKSELKSIIKECIYEIFSETFGKDFQEKTIQESILTKKSENRSSNDSKEKRRRSIPDDVIRQIIPESNSSNENVMASIFADTASTTLSEQNDHERKKPHVETGVDPMIFEGSKNWAALAFGDFQKLDN